MIRNLSNLSLVPQRSNPNVLVVDDDHEVLGRLAALLENNGLKPSCFDMPAAALAHRNGGYPLAFIDINLPDMGGLELASRLKTIGEVQDIVFMSSGECLDMPLKALRAGAWDFLHKPLCDNELSLLLQRFRERQELLQRVAEAELKHSLLIQDLPILVFGLNRRLELTFINHACNQVLGFSVEEAMEDSGFFLGRLHPKDRESIRKSSNETFQSKHNFTLECRLLHRHGQVVHGILRSIAGPCDSDTPLERLDGVFMDITDRVYLEKILVQNEKLKTLSEVSAEVAHEIRNPLVSIAGFARRLEQKTLDHPEAAIILRESQRLEKLLNRISEYLKPVDVNQQLCQVNAIIEESIQALHTELQEKAVRFETSLKNDLSEAIADPQILQQAFVNVFRFAIARTPAKGSLPVRTLENKSHVLVEVSCPYDETFANPGLLFLPFDGNDQNTSISQAYRLIKNMRCLLSVNYEGDTAVIGIYIPKSDAPLPIDRLFHELERSSEDRNCFDIGPAAVLNRSRFDELLERKVRLAAKDRSNLSLIFIDVQGFNDYQRLHGQAQSKEVLSSIGEVLEKSLPKPWHILGNYGVQEFVAILPGSDKKEALSLAESMDKGIRTLGLPNGNGSLPGESLHVRFGVVSCIPEHQYSAQDIIAQSVKALFKAGQQDSSAIGVADACGDN